MTTAVMLTAWTRQQLPVHRVLDDRGAERQRRRGPIGGVAQRPDVGGVVGANGGRDCGSFEESLLEGKLVESPDRHEHEIDDILPHDASDLLKELGAGAEAVEGPATRVALRSGVSQPESHVRILGIADHEVAAGRRVSRDMGKSLEQALLGHEATSFRS